MRDYLLLFLLKAFCDKLDGHLEPEFPTNKLNYFIASDALSRNTFDFVSETFLGTYLRTIQISNDSVRQDPFIMYKSSIIRA